MKKYEELFYPNTKTLKNLLKIEEGSKLHQVENELVTLKIASFRKKNCNFEYNKESLQNLHKYLFGKIYPFAGKFREHDIAKGEEVLDGRTVRYCPSYYIDNNLEEFFKDLKNINWNSLNDEQKVNEFANLINYLWSIHPFYEGNTRTTTLFMEAVAKKEKLNFDFSIICSDPKKWRDSLVKYSAFGRRGENDLIYILKNSLNIEEDELEIG